MKSALLKIQGQSAVAADRMVSGRFQITFSRIDTSDSTFHKYTLRGLLLSLEVDDTMLFNKLPISDISAAAITVQCADLSKKRMDKSKEKFPRPMDVTDADYTAALENALTGPLTIRVGEEYLIRPDSQAAKDTFPKTGDIAVLRGLGAQFFVQPDKTKEGLAQIAEKHVTLLYTLPTAELADGTISPIALVPQETDTLPAPIWGMYDTIRDGLRRVLSEKNVPEPYPAGMDELVQFAMEKLEPEFFMTTLVELKAVAQQVVSTVWAMQSHDAEHVHLHGIAVHHRAPGSRWEFVRSECQPMKSLGPGREYPALGMVMRPSATGPSDLMEKVAFSMFDAPEKLFGITKRDTWELLHTYLIYADLPLSVRGEVILADSGTSVDTLSCRASAIAYDYRALMMTYGLQLPDVAPRLSQYKPDPEISSTDKKAAAKQRTRIEALRRIAAESGVFLVLTDARDAMLKEIGKREGAWFVLPRIMTTDAASLMDQFEVDAPQKALAMLFTQLQQIAERTRKGDPAVYQNGQFRFGKQAALFQATASETQLLAFVQSEPPKFSDALRDVVRMQWSRQYQSRVPRQPATKPAAEPADGTQGTKRALEAPEVPAAKAAAVETPQ